MNFRDYLPLAAVLATGKVEADWRSAVSRAYYGTFHVARRLLSDLRFTIPRSDRAHHYLVLRLMNASDPSIEQAGRDLETLRRLRNRADYDESPSLPQREADGAVRSAKDIILSLDAARQEPTRTQITDAMKVYERDVLRDVTWRP